MNSPLALILAITATTPVQEVAPRRVEVSTPGAAAVSAQPSPYCSGEYADDFSVLSPQAHEFEQKQPPYTYCIRTTAVYECPSYGPDGSLRRARRRVTAHGTGFGYRQQAGDTLIVTNEHVAEWPAVTDPEHPVDDVPAGCKRVSDALRIVDDEGDAYERDDIPLSRVVVDPHLDIAVLRAKTGLPVIPWKIGRSSTLRERNVVDVRGFPLGVLRTNNVGKVISAYDHDDQRDWDHDDFVIDALLSPGNSGSPVFAVSCRTGELELVGVYHAGYEGGSALNVVIGIDQAKELLTTLKRSAPSSRAAVPEEGRTRERLLERARAAGTAFFPFGNLVAQVKTRPDGALVFALQGRGFPLQNMPALVFEDLPVSPTTLRPPGRMWAGNRQGLREIARSGIDADTLAQLAKLLDALRHDALVALDYRSRALTSMSSREAFQEAARAERSARRNSAARVEQAQAALELAERLCPDALEAQGTLADALISPPPGPGTPPLDATPGPAPEPDPGARPVSANEPTPPASVLSSVPVP